MKINIKTADRAYGQALALTLARCLKSDVFIDAGPGQEIDINLCEKEFEDCFSDKVIVISKFEPVSGLIERLRVEKLKDEGVSPANVMTIAVTGRGGSGVSTVAEIGAAIASELMGKTVLSVSFNGVGGPSELLVYKLLTSPAFDLSSLKKDSHGVLKMELADDNSLICSEKKGEVLKLNPLGRLSKGEATDVLSALGHLQGLDLIVIDVPLASPHWSLAMKLSELIVTVCDKADEELDSLIQRETAGFSRILHFVNRPEDGIPDMLSETGAAIWRFIKEELC